jgi:Fe-S cluster biogenesis protein NfuA
MGKQDEFQQQAMSIDALLSKLENVADPALKATARDLVKSLMELHGAAFERLLEIVYAAGDPGRAIIDGLGRDEMVSSLLLLYDLHPFDLRTRIGQALQRLSPSLRSHNATAELLSIDGDGTVTVQFSAKASDCGASSLRASLEVALQNAAPDVTSIHIEDTSPGTSGVAFVPLERLAPARVAAAPSESPHAGND